MCLSPPLCSFPQWNILYLDQSLRMPLLLTRPRTTFTDVSSAFFMICFVGN